MEAADLIARVESEGVEFINLHFTDILGTLKAVTVPTRALGEACRRGVWFDGSSIEGFARIHESDMVLRPDLSTYAVLPWGPRQARLICDVCQPDGSPFPGDPRQVLRQGLERIAVRGLTYYVGPELEFFLFRRNGEPRSDGAHLHPVPHDVVGYFDFSPKDLASEVRADIMRALAQMGMQPETAHHECAAAQHEIDIRYTDALSAADNVMSVRQAVKAVAANYDLYATFMPKPIFGAAGSGMHVHQSFFEKADRNVFFDERSRYQLSPLALHFIAGQLAHARALAAVVAPTVNSYKRLTPGYEAPVYVCWARINRSALIRVPSPSPGRPQSTRVELRCPDGTANPYLALAAMLAAGLDGIERKLEPPEPVEENVYQFEDLQLEQRHIVRLPGSLSEALDALEQDEVVLKALGEHAAQALVRAKRAEWEDYRSRVSDWELERYLETT